MPENQLTFMIPFQKLLFANYRHFANQQFFDGMKNSHFEKAENEMPIKLINLKIFETSTSNLVDSDVRSRLGKQRM